MLASGPIGFVLPHSVRVTSFRVTSFRATSLSRPDGSILGPFLAFLVWGAVVGCGPLEAQAGTAAGETPTADLDTLPSADSDATPGAEADAPPGSHLEVLLMTIGQGDEVWEKFSHNALVVRDDRARTEVAYNWGMFDFNDVDFWPRFVQGRMRYSMQGAPASAWLDLSRASNRDVWLQTVNLTPGERLELQAIVREMDTEANRYYSYDYYRDNCSTRVRDVLDRVLDGRIRAATESVDTGTSYRWHSARLLQSSHIYYAGFQFLIGSPGDETISAWEEMFLPIRLKEYLDDIRITGSNGESVPLLGEAVHVVEAVRDPTPVAAPEFLLRALLLGSAIGVFFAGLGWMGGEGKRWGRRALLLSGAAWSTGVGLMGTMLMLAWFFTDHTFWAANENAFQANPLSLLLAGVLVREALSRNGPGVGVWAGIRLSAVAKVVGGVALAGLFIQVLPGLDQVNGEVLAVLLPAHVGLAWGVIRAWPPSLE